MPTGYTDGVQDGSITEFGDFAIRCARAFGATVTMKDEPLDVPIPESFAESDYYSRSVEEARREIDELESMSLKEAAKRAERENDENRRQRNELVKKSREQRERYSEMLAKVEAWKPPTDEHVALKDFMVQQLKESIRFDCHESEDEAIAFAERCYPTIPENGWLWRSRQIENAKERLHNAIKNRDDETSRTRKRNEWIASLRKSLKPTP